MTMRDYVTRRDYDAWISESAALAMACGFPIRESMINDNSGVIFGPDQYALISRCCEFMDIIDGAEFSLPFIKKCFVLLFVSFPHRERE